jgi:hypothetical protein
MVRSRLLFTAVGSYGAPYFIGLQLNPELLQLAYFFREISNDFQRTVSIGKHPKVSVGCSKKDVMPVLIRCISWMSKAAQVWLELTCSEDVGTSQFPGSDRSHAALFVLGDCGKAGLK